jgi:hypothetical protein
VDFERLTTDQKFCICQALNRKMGVQWDSTTVFTGFKKTYDPVRGEVLYKILTVYAISMKLVKCV